MRQVADDSGLTEGFISQVELGVSAPSLISLHKIATALDTNLVNLLARLRGETSRAHFRQERLEARLGSAAEPVYDILACGFEGAELNSCITHIPVGYVSELMVHDGEDFVFIIEGEILYEIAGRHYHLKAGDTLHFPATIPHRAYNIGLTVARELWVGTAALRSAVKASLSPQPFRG